MGGDIFFGVQDVTAEITGLAADKVETYDQEISPIADNLKPPVYLTTEVVRIAVESGVKYVLVVHIREGINKPYKTSRGEICLKQGANKRLLTDNAEIMRLFQSSGNLLADEMEVYDTSIDDIDEKRFRDYFRRWRDFYFSEKIHRVLGLPLP